MYGIESGKLPQQPSLMRAPDVQTPTSPGHAHARSRQKQKIDVATGLIPALNPVRAVQMVRGPEARMRLSVRLPRPAPGVVFLCLHKSWQTVSRVQDDAGKEKVRADRDDIQYCTVARLNSIFALVRYDALRRRIQISVKIDRLLTYTHTCGPTRLL